MLIIIARFCMLSALLLPFLRTSSALKCYVCTASRPLYRNHTDVTRESATLPPTTIKTDKSSSTDDTTTSTTTTTTTTTTSSTSTVTLVLVPEREKSPRDDPCWDKFTGDSQVQQVDCPAGSLCYKRVVRNNIAGDFVQRQCTQKPTYYDPANHDLDKNYRSSGRLGFSPDTYSLTADNRQNLCSDSQNTTYYLQAAVRKSAGIEEITCTCNTDLCNTAPPLSTFSTVLPLTMSMLVSVVFHVSF